MWLKHQTQIQAALAALVDLVAVAEVVDLVVNVPVPAAPLLVALPLKAASNKAATVAAVAVLN